MFRKKRIAIIIAIVMSTLVACTSNDKLISQESETPQETTTVNNVEITSAEEVTSTDNTSEVYGRVDVEDICKHIMINGKQVDFPWTLNSLGEGYEYSAYEMDEETKFGAALLTYQGKEVDIVQVYEIGDDRKENLIIKVNMNRYNKIKLYDIDYEMTGSDIIDRLGQPSNETDEYNYFYYNYLSTNIDIHFIFNKNSNKLISYTVVLTDEYVNEFLEVK